MEARLKLQLMSLLPRPVAEDREVLRVYLSSMRLEQNSQALYKQSSLKSSLPGLPKIGSGAIASH